VPADQLDRLVELGLPPAGDEDMGPFLNESPGRRQADAAVAAGDDRDLAFELPHRNLLSCAGMKSGRNDPSDLVRAPDHERVEPPRQPCDHRACPPGPGRHRRLPTPAKGPTTRAAMRSLVVPFPMDRPRR